MGARNILPTSLAPRIAAAVTRVPAFDDLPLGPAQAPCK
jgi:hypothetical protein